MSHSKLNVFPGKRFVSVIAAAAVIATASVWAAEKAKPKAPKPQIVDGVDIHANRVTPQWEIHDETRPRPMIITPPTPSTQDTPGAAPSDAVVLFDGKDLSQWHRAVEPRNGKKAEKVEDEAPTFKVADGAMTTDVADIETKEAFGDGQYHIEWSTPNPPDLNAHSQGRGNSGILLMGGTFEVQVLDSYENESYADGQAGAIYGQNPPLVNACRAPGQWQSYDIIWHGPKFDEAGKLAQPASVTVFQNGIIVQDHYTLVGPTGHHTQGVYSKMADKMPLRLQFHHNATRFRNIWFRPLHEKGATGLAESADAQPAASPADQPEKK